MSDKQSSNRRRNRVQGGWAGASNASSSLTSGQRQHSASTGTCQTSVYSGEQSYKQSQHKQSPFVYSNPKQNLMPAKKPPNFSWVIENVLAGSGLPSQASHIQYLVDHGFKHVVSLTHWKPSMHNYTELNHIHMAIPEFEAPELQQAIDFVSLLEDARENNQPLLVHCHWGIGRTGTMIACYFIKSEGISPREAIKYIRQLRPYSIETYEQEDLVYEYAEHLSNQ